MKVSAAQRSRQSWKEPGLCSRGNEDVSLKIVEPPSFATRVSHLESMPTLGQGF